MLIDEITDDAVRWMFEENMQLRKNALALEKEAETLKKVANDNLISLFDLIHADKVECEGVGSVSRVTAARTTVDHDKLKEELVNMGTPVDTVVYCFNNASKTTESTSVRFTAEKVR